MSTAETSPISPIRAKWGAALDAGFVVTPTVLIKHQGDLGISGEELAVLLNLFLSWRDVEDKPYPRSATMAKRMGVTDRTVQRRIASLEKKGLIRREWGHPRPDGTRTSTRYDLTGIVGKLRKLGADAGGTGPAATHSDSVAADVFAAA